MLSKQETVKNENKKVSLKVQRKFSGFRPCIVSQSNTLYFPAALLCTVYNLKKIINLFQSFSPANHQNHTDRTVLFSTTLMASHLATVARNSLLARHNVLQI